MNIHELDGAGCPCVGWCFEIARRADGYGLIVQRG